MAPATWQRSAGGIEGISATIANCFPGDSHSVVKGATGVDITSDRTSDVGVARVIVFVFLVD